ncbi:glucuronate isomerase [Hoeflea prorocentri]|uniref:Uronate isomerase n=1 Tax=Hoeflea prorocentri TaxID=1922333 RepID=A0A9X3ZGJ5_9HYPH|nr:glucuronate isomerase [Hoeflea prorocentri]MCY6379800.1 glucuronate isomerase [Hoeflea prorocentri]MDA5397600.1 glucuronate isomerase [Hoeflea prorocentri]
MNNQDRAICGDAEAIYAEIKDAPIVSPHGHCDPAWFCNDAPFDDPSSLLIKPDHYVFRMLYSQGVDLADLGLGDAGAGRDPRAIFRLFASNWHLFLGTASRRWLDYSFKTVFGIEEELSAQTADRFYDRLEACLQSEAFRPRALFEKFNIEVLATTDGALDNLEHHAAIRASDWSGRIVPTFRPDSVINPAHVRFCEDVRVLGELTGEDTGSFDGYLRALRARRVFFKAAGATATDHDVSDLYSEWLGEAERDALFKQAAAGSLGEADAVRLHGHMLIEMAQMSVEDGLVMQLHAGSVRSTNRKLLEAYGPDMGADIPKSVDWVHGLGALLNRVGNSPDLTLILFTLDESTYSRELAPMVGHWPALRLGPPWWFHDSEAGIARYFDRVVESAGYWNLAGFNDDTRAFTSIPARHDLWRRGVAVHLGEQISRGRMTRADAGSIARLLACDLARDTYRLGAG